VCDNPKLLGIRWKKYIEHPTRHQKTSTKYRNLLPLRERPISGDDDSSSVTGLYFVHELMILRVFIWSMICAAVALVVALHFTDTSTGFTVGNFILTVITLFVAVIALALAMRPPQSHREV